MDELVRLFLREKPSLALLAVDELDLAYAALVAKRIDSTFPHTTGILSRMEKSGLIRARPEGRVRYLELTDRGVDAVAALRAFMETLEAPLPSSRRLDRLTELVEEAEAAKAPGAELLLGPLRRDLARLEGDEDLREAAKRLDERVLSLLRA